jgi:glycosyltransferase involved in cell wall biosynthesis
VQELPKNCRVHVVVVDNEGSPVTKKICDNTSAESQLQIIYCSVTSRGLSYVRNKAIDVALETADFLAFIDDDEVPISRWLMHLVSCQEAYNADAVSGPVIPYFTSTVPEWIRIGRFFDRDRHATGTRLKESRTGNVLLKVSAIADLGGFDDRYALTGGEDSDFFIRLFNAGGRIIWSDDAVVEEWLPPSRTCLTWLLLRAYRLGTTAASCHYGHLRRSMVTCRGLYRSSKGLCLLIGSVVRGMPSIVKAAQQVLFGAGMIAGSFGRPYHEYRRIHAA